MNKVKLNIFTDIITGLLFLVSATSGLVLKFFLPNGSGKLGRLFLNLVRENWLSIHDISSIGFLILIIIHLLSHWKWILNIPSMLKQNKK